MTIEIVEELKTFKQNVETKTNELDRRVEQLTLLMNRPGGPGDGEGADAAPSLARQLFDAPEFKSWARTARGRFAWAVETKALTSASLGLTTGTVPRGIAIPGVRGLRVRDLLRVTPTDLGAIPYAKETAFTNNAYPAAEASTKGESELTVTSALAAAATIAHWTRVPRQALDDLAILRSYIDGRLRNGLANREDSELLRGDGTGAHLLGLIASATAYETGRNQSGDQSLDKLSHACSQLEESEFSPTGIVLNPADWRSISLLKDESGGSANTGSYLIGGPSSSPDKQLWGLPVATTTAMPTGRFLIGDFTAAEMFERMGATVEISDSHGTFFVENMLAVRCEERVALAVYRGDAFVYGAF